MSTRSAHSYCRGHMAQAQIYRQNATASGVGERQFTETNARYLVYTTNC